MKKINPNKANDIYKIKPTILRDLTPYPTPILTKLFNRSIDENEYPDSLKYTKAIELYKAKDKTLPENYRPISLLPIIAKLLDTLINNQLMSHLVHHNIISPTQYAFRPHSSTTLALQTIIDKIMKHKSGRTPTLAIYIDLSKAYDTISHEKLIHKLETEFNFTTNTLAYFKSYFQNRHQSLHTQHAQSRTQVITHGIPQGSTLSTTFFLLYINNIIHTVPNSKVYTYADDTTLIITADTMQDLEKIAQSELNNLIHYFHRNNLVPNPTKTNYTIFYPTPNKRTTNIHLRVNGKEIQEHKHTRLLGYMMQDTLKHEQTVTNIIRKLQPVIHKLRYANKLLPTKNMKEQYYAQAYPHLIRDITIWGTNKPTSTYLQPLIRTQKKLIRIITKQTPRTHTGPLMSELEILNIPNLYILRTGIEVQAHIYPPTHTSRPEHSHNYISTAQIHEYPTRHSQQLHHYIPNKRKQPKHSMGHITSKNTAIWNTLPLELRMQTKPNVFKKDLKRYLLEKQREELGLSKVAAPKSLRPTANRFLPF